MNEYCYNVNEKNCVNNLKDGIFRVFGGKKFIVCCIGTDAVIGDCLGPMVGSRLRERLCGKTYVFGSVERPIIAKDVKFISEFLKISFPDCEILAIDAAFGYEKEVGTIKLTDKPLKPGLGVNKDLPMIGTRSIMGILAKKGDDFLNSVRFSTVLPFVSVISQAIEMYFEESGVIIDEARKIGSSSSFIDVLSENFLKDAK